MLNLIILIVFGYEIWKDLDVIEDKKETVVRRRKYAIRLALSTITVFIALMFIYSTLGVSTSNILGLA